METPQVCRAFCVLNLKCGKTKQQLSFSINQRISGQRSKVNPTSESRLKLSNSRIDDKNCTSNSIKWRFNSITGKYIYCVADKMVIYFKSEGLIGFYIHMCTHTQLFHSTLSLFHCNFAYFNFLLNISFNSISIILPCSFL